MPSTIKSTPLQHTDVHDAHTIQPHFCPHGAWLLHNHRAKARLLRSRQPAWNPFTGALPLPMATPGPKTKRRRKVLNCASAEANGPSLIRAELASDFA